LFAKVTVAAEQVLDRSLPGLVLGTAARQPLDLKAAATTAVAVPKMGA